MKPANLIVVMSDEHDPRFRGASGHPLVKTPTFDRMATTGVSFTNAYTPCPICVPARAAFATGERRRTRCDTAAQTGCLIEPLIRVKETHRATHR